MDALLTFIAALKVAQDEGYSKAAALTFLTYDIVSMLDDEVG
ncbi:hypothetical protein MD484_g6292, partial [Candolleomyces efflorescens]